jgi:hypothetical protein
MLIGIFWITLNLAPQIFVRYTFLFRKVTGYKSIFLALVLFFAILPAFITYTATISSINKFYKFFGVGHLLPNFMDLRGALAAIEKVTFTGESYSINCDNPYGTCLGWKWTYGSLILKLKVFTFFSERFTLIIAICITLLVLLFLSKLLDKPKNYVYIFPFVFTGTFLILFERLNLDILVPLILFLLAYTKERSNFVRYSVFLGYLFISETKYYTFIVLPIIILFQKNRDRILYFIISIPFILITYSDLKSAGLESINYGYAATYGLRNWFGLVNAEPEPKYVFNPLTISLLTFLIFCGLKVSVELWKNIIIQLPEENYWNFELFVYGTATFIFTMFAASNYPYRLACLICIFPYIINNLSFSRIGKLHLLILLFWLFATLHITFSIFRNTIAIFAVINLLVIVYYSLKNSSIKLNSFFRLH